MPLRTRTYGTAGPYLIVVHGGPGAPGYMAPVARALADAFRVVEPLQRGSGPEPLTVAQHVADMHEVVEAHCGDSRPCIVGHSLGAMLALQYHAGAHPERVGPLALVGCGTFDPAARESLLERSHQRISDQLQRRIVRLHEDYPDPDARLKALGALLQPVYSHDLVAHEDETEACDAQAHDESWADMLRLQRDGLYPAAFAAIRVPVLMLHGADDPHPGRMIRDSLAPYLPQLEYREWPRCGHYPWLEVAAREEFLAVLHEWLIRNISADLESAY